MSARIGSNADEIGVLVSIALTVVIFDIWLHKLGRQRAGLVAESSGVSPRETLADVLSVPAFEHPLMRSDAYHAAAAHLLAEIPDAFFPAI